MKKRDPQQDDEDESEGGLEAGSGGDADGEAEAGSDDDEALGDLDAGGEPPAPEVPTVVPPRARAGGRGARAAASADAGRGLITPLRDPLERFLAEARRYPRLSDEEERALGTAVRDRGDMDAARRLVVHNLRLVVAIAYQYRRAWTNILDLVQEGSVGLMEAVKRWEPKLGPRFGTYAAYWIRAFILRFLMTNSRLIHVGNTRAGRKLFFRLEKERQKLMAAGFEPTPKLLAAKLEVSEHDLDEVRQHLESREVPLEPRPGESTDEGYGLSDKLAGSGRSPESEAARAELADAVNRFTTSFRDSLTDEREVAVWREHLAADEPLPLGALGERFGVTKQRMGQIADKLKKRFREEILQQLGPEIRTDWLGAEE